MSRVIASALLMAAVSAPLRAQATPARGIRGRVVRDGSTDPIAFATIDVVNAASGTAAGRVTSARDGNFRLAGLGPGRYRVTVRALGFAPATLPIVSLTTSTPEADVGVIGLTVLALQLETQAVTAQRQDVQIEPDRTTYVVRDMPTTKGGTALDVLRNVPSVDVDIDNNVSLRGNSDVVIQINGRPSPLKGSQLGNFLEQLPADAIDHVEIVPNPSAREDAGGVGGIINIVLRQKPDAGTSGSLTLGGGTTGHVDVGANGGWQRGPWSAFGGYSLLRDSRPRSDAIWRENLSQTPRSYLRENGTRTQIPLVHTVNGNVSYQPDDHDQLAASGMYSQRREWETQRILYETLDTVFTRSDLASRHSHDVNHEGSAEAALNYKHRFATKGHSFSSDLSFEEHFEGGPTDIVDQSLWPTTAPPTTTLQETRIVWTHSSSTSLRADYARPLTKGLRVEAGYRGDLERIRTTQEVREYDSTRSAMRADSSQASDFAYDELVNDAYGMLTAQLGRVELQGGLRAEHAAPTFELRTRAQRYDNPYNSLFPSGLVLLSLDDADQLRFSYSTRIRRPDDPDLLDPTPHALDALNISVGNPYLRPEYIRAFELGFERTGARVTWQVTPFYRHSFDAVRPVRTLDTTGVTTLSYANIATTDAYGTDVTVALGSGGRVSGFVGGSAYHERNDASNVGSGLSASTFGWSARTNAAVHVSRTVDAQALLWVVGRTTVDQGWRAARTRCSLGLRDKLLADRLSLTLRIIDPFNTARERSATLDPRFVQLNDRTRSMRGLQLNATWSFGLSDRKKGDQIDLDTSGP